MTLPLYANHQAPKDRPASANAGLWFERFFDQFGYEWQVGDQKKDWLQHNFARAAGHTETLQAHATKQQALSEQLKGQSLVFATHWHFVTGMGNPHPVENGVSWHHTLGVPFLSGAAVKGIVRNWLEIWAKASNDAEQKAKLRQWFGSDSKETADTQAGELIFFDAFPIEAVQMGVDIMTPHMGKWYEQGAEIRNVSTDHAKVPADWHEPTPIPYLVVKKARFLFSVAPRRSDCTIDLNEVMDALACALDFVGAGAKTATGYGQMLSDQKATEQLTHTRQQKAHQAKLKTLSPEQQSIAELQQLFEKDQQTGNKTAGSITSQTLAGLIKQAENWSAEDKQTLADLGEKIYGFVGWGNNAKKKKEKKANLNKLRGQ